MTRIVKYQPEQIERGQKRLRALPVKDLGKTKEETAGTLAKDVQAILKRGYTLKEVCAVLREEGIVLSVPLLEGALTGQEKMAPSTSPTAPKTKVASSKKREKKTPEPAPSYPAVTPDTGLSEL